MKHQQGVIDLTGKDAVLGLQAAVLNQKVLNLGSADNEPVDDKEDSSQQH